MSERRYFLIRQIDFYESDPSNDYFVTLPGKENLDLLLFLKSVEILSDCMGYHLPQDYDSKKIIKDGVLVRVLFTKTNKYDENSGYYFDIKEIPYEHYLFGLHYHSITETYKKKFK
jgi:hypothetical protein